MGTLKSVRELFGLFQMNELHLDNLNYADL
jgi:hypothetical protein